MKKPTGEFILENVYTGANAESLQDKVNSYVYGYFCNTIAYLKKAVEEGKTNMRCVYGRLSFILPDTLSFRFTDEFTKQSFNYFYPMDNFNNSERF